MKKSQKHILTVLCIASLFAVVLTGCSKKEAATTTSAAQSTTTTTQQAPAKATAEVKVTDLADGLYYAAGDEFESSGWKSVVFLTVKGGKITDADWNAVNVNGGADKKTYDKAGKYRMVAYGKAQAEWYQQAEKVEQYLISTQDPTKITYTDGEHTDAISGATISVNDFFTLAQKALANGPVTPGTWQDGTYFAISDSYGSSGWKEYVSLNVLHGVIVGANWSAINRTGDDKKPYDKAGKYGMMAKSKAKAEWYQQAEKVEQYLISTQDPTKITYTDGAHTDAISGATITVSEFFELAQEALAAGPIAIGPYTDGGYYAQAGDFGSSGWKSFVSLLVRNGNIVNVYWSGWNKDGSITEDKQTYAAAGKYNMKAAGAIAEWDVQAQAAEQYLLKTQDLSTIVLKDNGHSDSISGATISVSDFVKLAQAALDAGVIKYTK
jgi:major membrane immunogen (membrane-anchored lipoprotein)